MILTVKPFKKKNVPGLRRGFTQSERNSAKKKFRISSRDNPRGGAEGTGCVYSIRSRHRKRWRPERNESAEKKVDKSVRGMGQLQLSTQT